MIYFLYTVKKVSVFPVLSRDVTNQTLPGREKINYSRPGRVYIPAGDGEIANLFLQCMVCNVGLSDVKFFDMFI